MARWYFSLKGKAEGPVSEAHLLEGLKAGRLTLVDLVFREGDAAWCTLGEIPRFREAFQALPAPVMTIVAADSSRARASLEREEGMPAWVVLRKKSTGAYEQLGPYSADQLSSFLAAGEIEYSQYAWKAGYKRWVRIGNLPEFDRRKRDRSGDDVNQVIPLPSDTNVVPSLSREELMDNVVRMDRVVGLGIQTEIVPAEATGVDLASGEARTFAFAAEPTEIVSPPARAVEDVCAPGIAEISEVAVPEATKDEKSSVMSESASLASVASAAQVRQRGLEQKPPGARRAARLFFAGIAAGTVIVATLQYLDQNQKRNNHDLRSAEGGGARVDPRPKVESIPGIIQEGAPSAASVADPNLAGGAGGLSNLESQYDPQAPLANPPESEAVGGGQGEAGRPESGLPPASEHQGLSGIDPILPRKGSATQLELLPLGLATGTPLLVFQTDAGVGDMISVTLKARSGEVLKVPSYERTVSLVRAAGEVPSLDLAKLGLPQGGYHVVVTTGELKREADIFLGSRGPQFEAELERHLKAIAQKQQSERKVLYYSAKRFEGLAKELNDSYLKFRNDRSKWRFFYSAWKRQMMSTAEPVLGMKTSSGEGGLAYPDEMKELRVAIDQLAEQSKLLDRAIEQRRQVASQKPLTLVRDFGRLKERAAQLTGRPSGTD